MLKIFEFIMHGCWHKWIENHRRQRDAWYGFGPSKEIVYCTCEKCGKPTSFKI